MASISQPIYPLVAGLGAVQERREWAYCWFSLLERMPCNCINPVEKTRLGPLMHVTRFLSAICLVFLYCKLGNKATIPRENEKE